MAVNCDPASIMGQANCFTACVPDGFQPALQSYLIAQISASISGTSTDPATLAKLSTCYRCLDGDQAAVQSYLVAQIATAAGAGNFDPSTMVGPAACFFTCIPDGYQPNIQLYLLAQLANTISGTSIDPAALVKAAVCFRCLDGIQEAVQTYLLCQIASGLAPAAGSSSHILTEGGDNIATESGLELITET